MNAIDPRNVKVGDTVTLESVLDEPFEVTGVVEKINVTQTDSSGKATAFNVMIWARWFTVGRNLRLAAHQPAPEPEPAPGHYTVHPTANPEAAWTGLVFEDGSFVGEEDGFYRSASKGEFTVSERLVVIDPAKVGVAALTEVLARAWRTAPWGENAHTRQAREALAHLGIEAS